MDPVVAILAGGRSSRMGRPKPTLALGGRPLLSYPLAAARGAGLEAWIIAKPGSELPPNECRVLLEPEEPRHPLCGVVAALREARPAPVLALAADMPFVTPELLRRLADRGSTAAAESAGRLQPLLARYDAEVLEALEAALAAGAAATAALAALEPETIEVPNRLCFNVNSPDDLERAEQLLAA